MKNNYPDSFMIRQYLEGKLEPEVMHQLEKQALDDPFLWEALEGLSNASDPARDLSILQRQLHERIVHLQENKKIFDLTWQRLSVAAAAAVLFISGGILFWMNSPESVSQLASSQKQTEVRLMEADPVSPVIVPASPSAAKEPQSASQSSQSRVSAYKAPQVINEDLKAASITSAENAVSADKASVSVYNSSETQPELAKAAASSRTSAVSGNPDSASQVISAERKVQSEVIIHQDPDQIAAPRNGWQLYQQYLKENTRHPKPIVNGTVLLSFRVEKDGRIKDIKVLNGINDTYNAEAIRLVKTGPDWKGAADGLSKEVRLEIVF